MRLEIRLLAIALLSSCTSISAIPRYGRVDLDGDIGIHDTGSGSSGQNDLKEAGLQDDTSVLSGRFDLEAGGIHATFELADSSHDGSGTLEADISDGTNTIPAGTDVDSELSVMMGEAIVTFDLVPTDLVEVGLGFGASLIDVDAAFTAPSLSQTIATDQLFPIPVVALRGGLDFGGFDISALLGGMDAQIDGNQLAFYDVDVMARLKIFGAAGRRIGAIVVGWRYVDVEADYEDSDKEVDTQVRFSGPYAGLSLGF